MFIHRPDPRADAEPFTPPDSRATVTLYMRTVTTARAARIISNGTARLI